MGTSAGELRAPDPTLMQLGRRGVLIDCAGAGPLVAHGFDGIGAPPPCGDPNTHRLVSADVFAYIAVPCRECFPDAPPPGEAWSRYALGRVEPDTTPYLMGHPHLGWQTRT